MIVELSEAEFAALRAQVASLAALLDALQPQEQEARGCPHVETIDLSTFGHRDVRCASCGESIDESPE